MTIPQILLTPPWQDKASRIKAPKLPETLVISELPKLFLKGNPVPLSDDNVQNFLGLLFKSDNKQRQKTYRLYSHHHAFNFMKDFIYFRLQR